MAFCGNCGHQLEDGVAACPNCGTPVPGAAQAATEAAQAVNDAAQNVGEAAAAGAAAAGAAAGMAQDQFQQQTQQTYQQAQGQFQQQTYQQQTYQQQTYQQPQYQPVPAPKPLHPIAAGMWAYIFGWIGFIVCIAGGEQTNPYVRFHTNQSLVINLFALISFIPLIGWIWGIFMLVCVIFGLIGASKGEMREIPLLGKIKILK